MFKLGKLIQTSFITLILCAGLGQPAQAGLVGTQDLVNNPSISQDIASLRQSIVQQLVVLGVESEQAHVRVASLSDTQVSEISGRINELPAGADAGGILLTIFIVFVITDVIGATDIFPFIHPVK